MYYVFGIINSVTKRIVWLVLLAVLISSQFYKYDVFDQLLNSPLIFIFNFVFYLGFVFIISMNFFAVIAIIYGIGEHLFVWIFIRDSYKKFLIEIGYYLGYFFGWVLDFIIFVTALLFFFRFGEIGYTSLLGLNTVIVSIFGLIALFILEIVSHDAERYNCICLTVNKNNNIEVTYYYWKGYMEFKIEKNIFDVLIDLTKAGWEISHIEKYDSMSKYLLKTSSR